MHWNIARHASSGAEPIHQLKCEAVSGSTGANPLKDTAITTPQSTSLRDKGEEIAHC
ncbi:MAG: hypothetical protein PCALPYG08_1454 [uncultured Paraburkholderia sp.]|nr:MAG: hypothetical protein PCALPYG08_1454 [uncultured Paraburkholderia sp.]